MISSPLHKKVALIVAHPDDETLWAGGTILQHPEWHCFIISICRASDLDRAGRFKNALKFLKANGNMADLNDGPEQRPLHEGLLEETILQLLPRTHFDLVITHNPTGEYTKHLRHEEVSRAVIELWCAEKLRTDALWTFAYEDGNKAYYPKAIPQADFISTLPEAIWQKKHQLITDVYGFEKESWEAQTTPIEEAFWQFDRPETAHKWLEQGGHPLALPIETSI
jgi:LmbE family N-acetylglucosaminyl deacetylase